MQHLQGQSWAWRDNTNLIQHLKQHHLAEFAKCDEASKGQHSGAKGKRQATASTETSQPPLLAYMNTFLLVEKDTTPTNHKITWQNVIWLLKYRGKLWEGRQQKNDSDSDGDKDSDR